MPARNDVILDEKKISRALTRITHEILEHNSGAESLVIIGIITRGAHLAKRIAATCSSVSRCCFAPPAPRERPQSGSRSMIDLQVLIPDIQPHDLARFLPDLQFHV